jgi:hypothetical protein
MGERMNTEEMLKIYAPEIPVSWFRKVRARLRMFIGLNGGDVELFTRFKGGKDQLTKWEMLDLPSKESSKRP